MSADSYNFELCTTAFKNHTVNVKKYFEERKDDLLILNVTEGDGWEKLCYFLGKEIPDEEFPIKYQKKERELGYRLRKLIRNPLKIPEYIMNRIRK